MVTRIGRRQNAHLYIEEWMEKLDLSFETIAGRLETSRTTVWRWCKEQHRLDPHKQAALAEAMGIKAQDLWRPPSRPSLDGMVSGVPDDLFERVKEVVQTMTRRAS